MNIKLISYVEKVGCKIFKAIPHYKFNKRVKLIKLLGNLHLIRSELDSEVLIYSNRIDKLSNIYNSIVHAIPIEQDSIYILNKFQRKISSTSEKVNHLLDMNYSTEDRIIKLNKNNSIKNPEIEKGIYLLIKKTKINNERFEILTNNIANLG